MIINTLESMREIIADEGKILVLPDGIHSILIYVPLSYDISQIQEIDHIPEPEPKI